MPPADAADREFELLHAAPLVAHPIDPVDAHPARENASLIEKTGQRPTVIARLGVDAHACDPPNAVGLPLVDVLLGRSDAYARPVAHARAGHVWVVNADGSDLRRLTTSALEAPILAPSPDGRHIALLAEDVLHVMNADGSELRMLADVGGSGGLAWCR